MKKPRASKRTRLPRQVKLTRSFVKDWQRLSRSGRYDMPRLKSVMRLLADNDAPLPPEWKDHPLKGQWSNHRECHVGGDFLLVYRIDDDIGPSGTVAFVRTGTHNELFSCRMPRGRGAKPQHWKDQVTVPQPTTAAALAGAAVSAR